MMRWFVLVSLALFISGCASRWEHTSKRPSEFYADDRECQVLTGGADQSLDQVREKERMSYESCMWDRGWRKKHSLWFFDPE